MLHHITSRKRCSRTRLCCPIKLLIRYCWCSPTNFLNWISFSVPGLPVAKHISDKQQVFRIIKFSMEFSQTNCCLKCPRTSLQYIDTDLYRFHLFFLGHGKGTSPHLNLYSLCSILNHSFFLY